MQLKNKAERERFLGNYRSWELMHEVPELELKFYRYVFSNGTVIIATEYAKLVFADYTKGHFEYKKGTGVRYHLILSDKDKYNTGYSDTAYKLYEPSGDSVSSIVKYLTDTKPDIETAGDGDVQVR